MSFRSRYIDTRDDHAPVFGDALSWRHEAPHGAMYEPPNSKKIPIFHPFRVILTLVFQFPKAIDHTYDIFLKGRDTTTSKTMFSRVSIRLAPFDFIPLR